MHVQCTVCILGSLSGTKSDRASQNSPRTFSSPNWNGFFQVRLVHHVISSFHFDFVYNFLSFRSFNFWFPRGFERYPGRSTDNFSAIASRNRSFCWSNIHWVSACLQATKKTNAIFQQIPSLILLLIFLWGVLLLLASKIQLWNEIPKFCLQHHLRIHIWRWLLA